MSTRTFVIDDKVDMTVDLVLVSSDEGRPPLFYQGGAAWGGAGNKPGATWGHQRTKLGFCRVIAVGVIHEAGHNTPPYTAVKPPVRFTGG